MISHQVKVDRLPCTLTPDPTRTITRFFSANDERTRGRIERVLALPDEDVARIVSELKKTYNPSHPDLDDIWMENYDRISSQIPAGPVPGPEHKLLIGAYFTMEYTIESAALFNPSIVPVLDPERRTPEPGTTRFIMSLRAVGEGHLSCAVFRSGRIDKENRIDLDPASPVLRQLRMMPDAEFDTQTFRHTLQSLGALGANEEQVLAMVGDTFSVSELRNALASLQVTASSRTSFKNTARNMMTIAESNYRLSVPRGASPAEVVIFPTSEKESHGIEDLRLVHFVDDDGSSTLYGTYTAYNGMNGFPSLLETRDMEHLEMHTIAGTYARNKGMALFPRKIDGDYVMSGRLDGENLFVLESDSPRVWNRARPALSPRRWWELAVMGNCGSPVETEEGWLLLTHGVGPMRQYWLGAALLDLDDPAREIGRLREPLIAPLDEERGGYVPNVVYTCGAMLHNRSLILPYAVSDWFTRFATVNVDELLQALKKSPN